MRLIDADKFILAFIDASLSSVDEDTILDVLTRHVKPVLMNIIKGEIFEEGDLAYDF